MLSSSFLVSVFAFLRHAWICVSALCQDFFALRCVYIYIVCWVMIYFCDHFFFNYSDTLHGNPASCLIFTLILTKMVSLKSFQIWTNLFTNYASKIRELQVRILKKDYCIVLLPILLIARRYFIRLQL